MTKVFVKNTSYQYGSLRPAVFEVIDLIGKDIIKKQDRVLIKPNFLSPALPEEAILTHPLVIKAAVEYVLEKGGQPLVADSPGRGTFKKIFETGGYKEALKGMDVECRELSDSVETDIGEPFGRIEIAKDAIEADVVINLPKLKSHSQMMITLGVKNLFGCIVGFKKAEWHFKAGVDRDLFARLLVKICKTINPAITLIDGILAMEGQGPAKSGQPRDLGVLAGSSNAIALDMAICSMLGMEHENVPTLKAAKHLGLTDDSLHIKGDFTIVNDFKTPEMLTLEFGPKIFHGFVRKYFLQRPQADLQLCEFCGECFEHCPADAISFFQEMVVFDYDKCIRCYCCLEVCPKGSIRTTDPYCGRVLRKLNMKEKVNRFFRFLSELTQ